MSKKAKANLEDFGRDLTAEAREGKLDPVIGRKAEMDQVILILARKTKRNPILLGEPGVGKTAVAEGLAHRIVEGTVPPHLRGKTLYSLSLGALLAGTGFRGDFEQRMQDLVDELKKPGAQRLLFIDEIHLLGKAGRSEGGMDAANFLKPLLARGEMACMGATTSLEWKEMIDRDPAMERRFMPVQVKEPSYEEAIEILRGLRPRFERHHGVQITDEALVMAVRVSMEQAPTRRLPDKAVDRLDEACARLQLQQHAHGRARSEADPRLGQLKTELDAAMDKFDLDQVAQLRYAAIPAASEAVSEAPVVDAAFMSSVV